jgi:hypothetical protein
MNATVSVTVTQQPVALAGMDYDSATRLPNGTVLRDITDSRPDERLVVLNACGQQKCLIVVSTAGYNEGATLAGEFRRSHRFVRGPGESVNIAFTNNL